MRNKTKIMRLIRKRDTTFSELDLVTDIPTLELAENLFSLVQKGQIKSMWKKSKSKSHKMILKKIYTLPHNEDNCNKFQILPPNVIYNKYEMRGKCCT